MRKFEENASTCLTVIAKKLGQIAPTPYPHPN